MNVRYTGEGKRRVCCVCGEPESGARHVLKSWGWHPYNVPLPEGAQIWLLTSGQQRLTEDGKVEYAVRRRCANCGGEDTTYEPYGVERRVRTKCPNCGLEYARPAHA